MPISSLLLEVEREREAELLEHLHEVPGIDVHESRNGHVVVTTDTASAGEDRKLSDYISTLTGVRSANVVYTNMEDIIMEDSMEKIQGAES